MYTAQKFNLDNLTGISNQQLEQHYKLYEGYVSNTNKLQDNLNQLMAEGKYNTPEYNELKRRFGWELNGVKLHEAFFGNLKANGGELPDGDLKAALNKTWGSYNNWTKDFISTGMIRGIGWAALYLDRDTGDLYNQWIAEHESNHFPNSQLLLIMDVWEHAYIGDYLATERKKYLDAFIININWSVVQERFLNVKKQTP